jgi:hypothetical protein
MMQLMALVAGRPKPLGNIGEQREAGRVNREAMNSSHRDHWPRSKRGPRGDCRDYDFCLRTTYHFSIASIDDSMRWDKTCRGVCLARTRRPGIANACRCSVTLHLQRMEGSLDVPQDLLVALRCWARYWCSCRGSSGRALTLMRCDSDS